MQALGASGHVRLRATPARRPQRPDHQEGPDAGLTQDGMADLIIDFFPGAGNMVGLAHAAPQSDGISMAHQLFVTAYTDTARRHKNAGKKPEMPSLQRLGLVAPLRETWKTQSQNTLGLLRRTGPKPMVPPCANETCPQEDMRQRAAWAVTSPNGILEEPSSRSF